MEERNSMKDSQVMIIGRNMVHDAIKSNKTIQTIFIGKNSRTDPRIQEILKLAYQKNIEISFVAPEKIRAMSGSDDTQNVIAYMQKYEGVSLREVIQAKIDSGKDPLIMLFNHMDYEQNLGAIIRSAWGAEVDAVVLSPTGVHEVNTDCSQSLPRRSGLCAGILALTFPGN